MTRTLQILDRLVAFRTVSSASNLDLIDWVETLLRDAGCTVWRRGSGCGTKAGLFASTGGSGEGIILSGHSDVVPVDGQDWTVAPWTLGRDGSRVYGRGTTDMKGFVASALAAMERAGSAVSRPLGFVLSYDEEVGCKGLAEMMPDLRRRLGRPELVVVGEPTGMKVGVSHKGKVGLRVRFHGESGHSSLAPRFVNALHPAARFVGDMARWQDDLAKGRADEQISYPTVHVGRLTGGRALNIVPDSAVAEVEIRHGLDDPIGPLVARLTELAKAASQEAGCSLAVDVEETSGYPAFAATDGAVLHLGRSLTGQEATALPYGTEAGLFAQEGHPVLVIGPGDMQRDGHKPDEGIDQSELAACDAMMDRVIARLR